MTDSSARNDESRATQAPIVVGVGASAGGLEALQTLVAGLPQDHDFAVVIVQHLDPDYESLMAELLGRQTATPVAEARDGEEVVGGRIYLIPPGREMTIRDGCLRLHPFAVPRGRRRPIDAFLGSLAQDGARRAVGVVVSGTGSDGAQGLQSVKEAGGLVFVQDPAEAQYDGMPRAAIGGGAQDFVLPVAEMFDVMLDVFQRLDGVEPVVMSDATFIGRVMTHVRYRTGHDFTAYRPATLLRRIAVRMSVLEVSTSADYLRLLAETPAEAGRLFRDILINVTRFFRDADVFDRIAREVIPPLLEGRDSGDDLRIWIAGCSTGQEAYTVAMLIAEASERAGVTPNLAIFATDIDEDALRTARAGIYPTNIVDDVPEDMLRKYFLAKPGGFEVSQRLRDMVRFSQQSIVKDPPFSRIDLVVCRNVLIYFGKPLQKLAVDVFHYALRPGGTLVLGTSENLTVEDGQFEEVSRVDRIFRRLPGAARPLRLRESPYQAAVTDPVDAGPAKDAEEAGYPYAAELLEAFAPPHIAVGASNELLFASASASPYLQMRPGRPQLGVLQLVRPEIEMAMRRLMGRDAEAGETVTQDYSGPLGDAEVSLTLLRRVLAGGRALIGFREEKMPAADTARPAPDSDAGEYVRKLERELDAARETIRSTVGELETSNEELKSSNEEMMSMNEELQSANQELTTANEELNGKVAEVRQVYTDLANFIRSTQIATVVLDSDLRLRTFTPEAQTIFRFVPADQGRRIDDIGTDLRIEELMRDLRDTVGTEREIETEYDSRDGDRVWKARIVPYARSGGLTGGIVFTLVDITDLRHLAREAERQTDAARRRLAEIEEFYTVSPLAMGLISTDLTYLRVNEKLAAINGMSVDRHIGRHMTEVVPDLGDQVSAPVRQVIESGQRIEALRVAGHTAGRPDDERIWETDWYPVTDHGRIFGVGVNVRDVTDEANMAAELRRVMQELQHRVKNMLANVMSLVNRAGREAATDRAVFETLSLRIKALSNTHKLLTQANWASTDLREVIAPELEAVYGRDRVTLKGPALTINARAALSLGMAVHELATNAAKYGAFSVPDGGVSLSWVRQDDGDTDRFIFVWRETGGPAVVDTQQTGFGGQLIRSTIEGSLGGQIDMDWQADGLLCKFTVPVGNLTEIPDDSIFDTLDA